MSSVTTNFDKALPITTSSPCHKKSNSPQSIIFTTWIRPHGGRNAKIARFRQIVGAFVYTGKRCTPALIGPGTSPSQ
ncbi:hypothetical protein RSAG8_01474, partial [Rhizoctonia solani AG-8 WAC10335]